VAIVPTSQDRILRELKRYVPRAATIGADHPELPEAWLPILTTRGDERLEYAFEPWALMATNLPRFLHVFARALRDVRCVAWAHGALLVYEVEIRRKRYLYAGAPPRVAPPDSWSPEHRACWANLDPHLHWFYEYVHDGFVLLPGRTSGPLSLEEIGLDVIVPSQGPLVVMSIMDTGAGTIAATTCDTRPDGFALGSDGDVVYETGVWELLDAAMATGLAR
jgi:hypothetical protein